MLNKELSDTANSWLQMVAAKWRQRAQQKGLRRTGRLLDSIRPYLIQSGEVVQLSVDTTEYAIPLSYGHVNRTSAKGGAAGYRLTKARPFLTNFHSEADRLRWELMRMASEMGVQGMVVRLRGIRFEQALECPAPMVEKAVETVVG